MFSALFMVCALLAAGYCSRLLRRFPDNGADVLNRFIIDVCLPATILRLVPTLKFDVSLVVLVITPWAMAGLAFVLAYVAKRLLQLSSTTQTVLFLTTALGNTSFLGFPLCSALLGEASVPLAAVYDQLGSFLLLSSLGPLALGSISTGRTLSFGQLAQKVITFPPFLALLIAVIPLPRPAFIEALLSATAAALVPLAMFSVGMKLRLTPPRPFRVLGVGLGIKLALLPGAAWLLCRLLNTPTPVLQVAVLETAMPTMITAGALIMAQGIEVELVAAFVGWGLVLSLMTVPLWAFILR